MQETCSASTYPSASYLLVLSDALLALAVGKAPEPFDDPTWVSILHSPSRGNWQSREENPRYDHTVCLTRLGDLYLLGSYCTSCINRSLFLQWVSLIPFQVDTKIHNGAMGRCGAAT